MAQEKVKALNSKLLYSDALLERQNQIELQAQIKEMDKKREQLFNEQLIAEVKKQEEEDRRAKQLEKEKNAKFEKDIRKQHKEVKKKAISAMKQEMEEGELLKVKAE
jgi:23S rRNA maturation-related 3'-5' exoribonuclease YhaM